MYLFYFPSKMSENISMKTSQKIFFYLILQFNIELNENAKKEKKMPKEKKKCQKRDFR